MKSDEIQQELWSLSHLCAKLVEAEEERRSGHDNPELHDLHLDALRRAELYGLEGGREIARLRDEVESLRRRIDAVRKGMEMPE